MGDNVSLSQIATAGAASLGAIGAGVALNRKRKNAGLKPDEDKQKPDEDKQLTKATTYEELEQLAQTQTINPHDYDDDLEMFAKAYVLSKEQKQNQNAEIKKKKIR